jgi:ATP-dependent helicase/nuclease subunit A
MKGREKENEQALKQIASNPENSAWVFALAGSGKTELLINRVLRILISGCSAEKILCITFTNAGASEMRRRIDSSLLLFSTCDENELIEKLKKIFQEAPSATQIKMARGLFSEIVDKNSQVKVQTIHSFCQSLIRIFPKEALNKTSFEIIDSRAQALLLQSAKKQVFRNALQNQELANVISKISAKINAEALTKIVSSAISKREKFYFLKEKFFTVENIIDEIFKKFSVSRNDDEEKLFARFLKNTDLEKIRKNIFILENSAFKKDKKNAEEMKRFLKFPDLESLVFYKLAFFTKEDSRRKIHNKSLEVLDFIASEQDRIKKFSEEFNSYKTAKDTSLFLILIYEILENYAKQKGLSLDYGDLIAKVVLLLENTEYKDFVKYKMDGFFDHILVDESQDTNQLQWAVINALTDDFFSGEGAKKKGRTVFIVGDDKQSIYGFQGSEPNISQKVFSFYQEKSNIQKINLQNSFRSLPKILEFSDKIFKNKNLLGSIDYEEHKAVRDGVGKVEIFPLAEEFSEKKQDFYAEIIAKKIKLWIENKRVLKSENRRINYGDIMILLKKNTNNFYKNLAKHFKKNSIPFSFTKKIKFSDEILIQDLLAAARFACLQRDDLNLACLLKSGLFSFSEGEILEVCGIKNEKKISLFEALEQTVEIYFYTIKKLEKIIDNSKKMNCSDFFYFLIDDEFKSKASLEFGREAIQILDEFLIFVLDFNKNSSTVLQKFLEFVDKVDPEMNVVSNEKSSVKITTIHSAKGLEAPIVLIPDCSFEINKEGEKNRLFFIDGLPIFSLEKESENAIVKNYKIQQKQEDLEESFRLFYVAITRARDELYIGGLSSTKNSWYEIAKNSIKDCAVFKGSSDDDFDKKTLIFGNDEEVLSYKNDIKNDDDFIYIKYPQRCLNTGFKGNNNFPKFVNKKGEIIHKILEIFGKNLALDKNYFLYLAEKIIAREDFFTEKEKNKLLDEVAKFVASSDIQKIFSNKIKTEVEVFDGKKIRRIDLIVEDESEVLVIDYKSDESLPDMVPEQYLQQMRLYKKLVQGFYVDRKIRAAILWTNFLKLDFIDEL